MKLEILKKLVALANNNPNDHEANLAARKVCKALIEDKYINQLHEETTTYSSKSVGFDPLNDLRDIMNRARQQQQQERQQQRPYSRQNWWYQGQESREWYNPFTESYYNPFETDNWNKNQKQTERDILQSRQMSWRQEQYNPYDKTYHNPIMNRTFTISFFEHWRKVMGRAHPDEKTAKTNQNTGAPEGFYWDNIEGKWKEGRELKCKTCGKVKGTKFKGAKEVFECNDCQWTAWTKTKENKEQKKKSSAVCGTSGKPCPTPVTCAGSGCQFKF